MQPWQTIDRIATPEGSLELRRRGERDWLITVGGRVLMTSAAHRSEDELAAAVCELLAGRRRPRVLVGGLGMGYSLRAALDRLPPGALVTVAEVNPRVVAWCRGVLAPLTARAVDDPRVTVEIADVARLLAYAAPGRLDAILLDLYEGPHGATQRPDDLLYGPQALARTRAALAEGGVLGVWSEEPDRRFETRLETAGFRVKVRRSGQGGRRHVVYLAVAAPLRERSDRRGHAEEASPPARHPPARRR